jgi:hypothetical protein
MNDPKTIFEPLAGYALDAVAKMRGRPFTPHSLTKLQNIKVCRDLSRAKTIVEVGSFKGVTTRRLSYVFDTVVSIEIVPSLYEEAKARCADRANVEVLLGDGSEMLPMVMEKASSALLYLDGHYSGGQTGQSDEPEPVLKELDLIAAHLDHVNAVVIDDYRLFGVEPGWPRKSEVVRKLEAVFPEPAWRLDVQYDQFLVWRR